MKICFFLSRYPGVGGIENVTSIIVSQLQALGHQCTIVSNRQAESIDADRSDRVVKLPETSYSSIKNREFMTGLLKKERPDVVIFQDSYAPNEGVVIDSCKATATPLVVFEHNSPLFVENKRNLEPIMASPKSLLRRVLHPYLMMRERKRKRRLLEACHRYVVLSEAFIADFARVAGVSPDHPKLTFINNPLAEQASPVVGKSKELLYVGRLAREKRVDMILDVWRLVQNQLPDWRLTIVGDGPLRSELENSAADLERVSFEGFRDPKPYFDRASIFLMTSKFEGWGMTLVEAMSHGVVPVALNTFSSVTDIIDSGRNGIIITPPRSINATISTICETLLSLTSDSAGLNDMSRNAREKVKKFGINKIIASWMELLNTI